MKKTALHCLFSYQRIFLGTVMCLITMAILSAQAYALTVKDIRVGLHPDKTRMVIELSEVSRFRTFVLADPWRLVVDLPSFDWKVGRISNPTQSAIKTVKQGNFQPGISRIVFDLEAPVKVEEAFLLRKDGGRPDRLVIDFTNSTAAAFAQDQGRIFGILNVDEPTAAATTQTQPAQTAMVAPTAKPPPPTAPQTLGTIPVPAPPPRGPDNLAQAPAAAMTEAAASVSASGIAIPQKKPGGYAAPSPTPAPTARQKYLIVIDPGHGGVDPGAIGANGIFEKHIALAAGRELKHVLESTGRYDVVLTRDSDKYLRLYQRVDIARARNADLFVSLHADSIGKPAVRGASVYTLSEKASDKQTAMLAERENKADIIAGADLSHEDQQVANILIDLAMRDTMNQSVFFANTLVSAMKGGEINLLESPSRHAGFAVLKAPDVPSVLIEMGFMSNKGEAQMLSTPEYRRKLTSAIARGINAYFDKVEKNSRI